MLRLFTTLMVIVAINAVPHDYQQNSQERGDSTGSEQIQSIQIDVNDPQYSGILKNMNVTPQHIMNMRASRLNLQTQNTSQAQNTYTDSVRRDQGYAMEMMKTRIVSAVNMTNQSTAGLPTGGADQPIRHEMAAYPLCTQSNNTSWNENNTIRLHFSSSMFEKPRDNTYLESALLRLYKKNCDTDAPRQSIDTSVCDEDDDLIKITVSTLMKKNKGGMGQKKRTVFTRMYPRHKRSWVEFDVRNAIIQWEKSFRINTVGAVQQPRESVAVGWIAIDVEDQDGVQLKAGQFFEPPNCEHTQYPGGFSDSNLVLQIKLRTCPTIPV